MKTCKLCGITSDLAKFAKLKYVTKSGIKTCTLNMCRPCKLEQMRENRRKQYWKERI